MERSGQHQRGQFRVAVLQPGAEWLRMSSSRQMARRPSRATQWCGAPGPAWPSTRREAAAPHRFRRPEQRPSWVALSSTHGRPAAPSDTGLTSSLRWGPAEARRPVAQLRSQAQRPNWSTRPTRP